MTAVLKSQTLRTSKFLVAFLQEQNQDKFNMKLLGIEEDKGPKTITAITTLTGQIEVEKKERASRFCDKLGSFAESYERINTMIVKQTKQL